MKVISILAAMFFLSSCGGGGNDTPTNEDNLATDNGSTRVGDLKVSSDFDFIGGKILTIRVVNESSLNERLYLNICRDFNLVNGQYQVNYDSCLLRTSIQNQYKEFEIVLSSNEQKLLAQVWPLTDRASPDNYLWHRSEDGNDWQITVF